jgi:hypothetical protein
MFSGRQVPAQCRDLDSRGGHQIAIQNAGYRLKSDIQRLIDADMTREPPK